jgi:hypothetical protein
MAEEGHPYQPYYQCIIMYELKDKRCVLAVHQGTSYQVPNSSPQLYLPLTSATHAFGLLHLHFKMVTFFAHISVAEVATVMNTILAAI